VNVPSGRARLLAQASAPTRAVLSRAGGLAREPASGRDAVLEPGEIAQLVALSREIPMRFPTLRDAQGRAIPADVEFAFRDGRLTLLQIRPLNESKSAQSNAYLLSLDSALEARGTVGVARDGVPGQPS
jgi:hypothetical protein